MMKLGFNSKSRDYTIITIVLFLCVSPVFPPLLRVLGFLAVYLVAIKGVQFITTKNLILLSLFSIFLLYASILDISALMKYGFITASFLYIPLSFLGGYIIFKRFTLSEYLDNYVKIMYRLSFLALILFTLVIIYPPILNVFWTYEYYDFTSKSILFLNVLTSETSLIYRNCGFASEPGLYQFFLNLALWWKLKQNNKIDMKAFIFMISIISTNSTAGLLCMLLILFLSSKGKVRIMVLLCFLAILPIAFQQIQYHISHKLVGSAAFDGRFNPFLNAFQYSLLYPFGIGSVEYSAIYKEFEMGGWDSFSQLVLRYGYQGLFLVVFCLGNITRKKPVLGAIMWVSFFSQAIWFYPVVSCFYFWSFSDTRKGFS